MSGQFAEVYRIEGNRYVLEFHENNNKAFTLFVNDTAKLNVEAHKLIEGCGNKIEFEMESVQAPHYFSILFEDGTTMLCGLRIVPIAGMYNFRDLGGYPTTTGKHVVWGRLFRGDHLHNMKEEGTAYLEALRLHSVIDFRSERECVQCPNTISDPNTIQYNFIPDGQIAAFAGSLQNNEAMNSQEQQILNASEQVKNDPDFASKSMIRQQVEFVMNEGSIQAYRDTLCQIAKEDAAPLYFHCKGGKDRTGYAAMLLLSILGVEEDLILYDYLLTNRAREKKNQRYLENFRKMSGGNETVAQYMYSLFDTRAEYILAAINEIKKNYETVEMYVRQVLKLSDAQINTIRTLYLT